MMLLSVNSDEKVYNRWLHLQNQISYEDFLSKIFKQVPNTNQNKKKYIKQNEEKDKKDVEDTLDILKNFKG